MVGIFEELLRRMRVFFILLTEDCVEVCVCVTVESAAPKISRFCPIKKVVTRVELVRKKFSLIYRCIQICKYTLHAWCVNIGVAGVNAEFRGTHACSAIPLRFASISVDESA